MVCVRMRHQQCVDIGRIIRKGIAILGDCEAISLHKTAVHKDTSLGKLKKEIRSSDTSRSAAKLYRCHE